MRVHNIIDLWSARSLRLCYYIIISYNNIPKNCLQIIFHVPTQSRNNTIIDHYYVGRRNQYKKELVMYKPGV